MTDKDYVLGTHDKELERLGLQHRVWRTRALDAWERAGFTIGHTILDIGSGPGYASRDLSALVGPTGRVLALERSERFLGALEDAARHDNLKNITAVQLDLDIDPLPEVQADGAWVRWVFAFLQNPRDLVTRIAGALRPGATIVIHEYLHYETWRFTPRSPLFEEFVRAVIKSWRSTGGEPDIGLDLPAWLEQSGFEVTSLRPHVDMIDPGSFRWQWPRAFVEVGLQRLVDIGELTDERGRAILEDFTAREREPDVRMVTPAVIEILATRL